MNEVTEEDILAGLDIHPFTKILYAMFFDQCRTLGLLHANGMWKDSPEELRRGEEGRVFNYARSNEYMRQAWRWEAELWTSTETLCAKLYDAGGLCFGTADVVRFAKAYGIKSKTYRSKTRKPRKLKTVAERMKKGAAA